MRKLYVVLGVFAVLFGTSFSAFAQPTVLGTELVNGSYNTYNLNTVAGFKQYRVQASGTPGSGGQWQFATGTAAATDYSITYRPNTSGNTLSKNAFIPTSFANGANYNSGGAGSSGILPTLTANNYYTFNVTNNAGVNNSMSLLETSFNPVTISSVTQFPAVATSTTAVTVTATVSSAPASGENVYVRYTTNAYGSSSLVLMSFVGTTGTAVIPAQASGAAVSYYVFSSNRSSAAISGDVTTYSTQAVYDMSTLNLNNNSGSNYSYTVSPNPILVTSTGGTSTSATYATLAAAIAAIKPGVIHTGTIVCTVNDGYTETAPAGGFVIDFALSNTSATPITFQRSNTGGSKPAFTAPAQTSASLNDAIFKIIGADYITIDGFQMLELSTNTTTTAGSNNMTEWGVALLYTTATNGAQHNTIKNCVITLNKTYTNTFGIYSNVRHTATAIATTADITAATGSNSFNKFYNNTISNVNYGVALIGSATAANQDQGNSVGDFASATGNTITNWSSSAANVSGYISQTGTLYGVFMNHQVADTVCYNTLTSATVSGTAVTMRGILKDYTTTAPTGTFTSVISNNTVTLNDAFTSGTLECIRSQGLTTLSTATLKIDNNTILNTVVTGASSSTSIVGVINSSAPGVLSMSGNIIQGTASTATSGGFTGVSNTGSVVTTITMNSNQIGNASGNAITFSAATSGAVNGINNSGAASTCAVTIQGNDFRGIVHSAAGSSTHIYILTSGSPLTNTVSTNTFTNLTVNTTGTIYFIQHPYSMTSAATQTFTNNSIVTGFNKTGPGGTVYITYSNSTSTSGSTSTYTNNTFSNMTFTGATTVYGFYNTDGGTGSAKTITGNTFSTWTGGTSSVIPINITYFSGTSSISNNTITGITGQSTVTGIFLGNTTTGTTLNVATNTITGLSSTSTGAGVTGISCSNTTTTVNINGNTINTLSSTNTSSAVSAISVSGAATTNVYSNTISGISTTGATTPAANGIVVSSGTAVNVYSNSITTVSASSAGTSPIVNGISVTGGTTITGYSNTIFGLTNAGTTSPVLSGIAASSGTTLNFYKNRIYNLSSSGSISTTNGAVNGILLSGGTTVNTYNNYISDLRAATASLTDAVRGISVTSATASSTYRLYFNTIYLNAFSSNTNFGTTGIYHAASATATTAALDLRNNIVINLSTAKGTGIVTALRRSSAATLGNYAGTSNNNLYYAGTPGAANLIMYDGTNSYQTFGPAATAGTFQNVVSTRESASFTGEAGFTYSALNNFFIDPTSSPADLHLKAGITTQCESGGQLITAAAGAPINVTDDYDADTRPNNGTTSLPDVGADEFAGVSPTPVVTLTSFYVASTTTAGTISQCSATGRDVTVAGSTPAGTLTTMKLTYNIGAGNVTVDMNGTSLPAASGTFTYTIPAASPVNTTVTWSVKATNSAGLTFTYTGSTYSDAPTTGVTATAAASPATVCSGNTSSLSLSINGGAASGTIGTASTLTGATTQPSAFVNRWPSYRIQTIYTAAELTAAGLSAGNITSMAYNTTTLGDAATNSSYIVQIGTTASSTFSSTTWASTAGFTTVFPSATVTHSASGTQTITFTTPYSWDGSSNILVDITYNGANATNNAITYYTATAGNTVLHSNTSGSAVSTGTLETTRLNITFAETKIPTASAIVWKDQANATVGSTNPLTVPVTATSNIFTGTATIFGCPLTSNAVTVTVNPLPTAPTNTSTTPQCGNPTYTASSGVSGATFHWYNAATNGTLLASTSSYAATSYVPGTNTVWVSVNNGTCESPRTQVDVVVNTPDPVAANANGSATPAATCPNTAIALSAVQTGTTNTYTYTWTCTSSNAATSGISGSVTGSPVNVTPTAAGTYTYLVTAVDGVCSTTSSVTIIVKAPPTLSAATATPTPVCSGAAVTLNVTTPVITSGNATIGAGGTTMGSISSTALGSPFEQYDEGEHAQYLIKAANLTSAGLTAGNLTALSFNISTKNSSKPFTSYTIKLSTSALSTLSGWASGTFTQVYASSSTLGAGYSTTAGTNTFAFGTGAGSSSSFNWDGSSNILVDICYANDPGSAGIYYSSSDIVTATAAMGYNASQSYGADNSALCGTTTGTPTAYTSLPVITFAGQLVTNGAGTLNYVWSDGTSTVLSANTGTVNPVNNTASNATVNYIVTATDPATTCFATAAAPGVTVTPAVPAPTNTSTTPQCGNPTYTASTTVSSPTFHWYDAATSGTLLATNTNGIYAATSYTAGSNTVWVSVNNGTCESPRTAVTITVNTPDAVTAKANGSATPAASCPNVAIALSAVQTGTTNTYTYTWTCTSSNAATSGISGSVSGNPVNVTPTAAGSYTYLVTAVDGVCTTTSSVTITVNTPPNVATATASPTPVCSGAAVSLAATTTIVAPGTKTLGAGGTTGSSYDAIFYHLFGGMKMQFLVKASELSALGITPGNITSLGINMSTVTAMSYAGFAINIAPTALTNLTTTLVNTGLTQVYAAGSYSPTTGTNTFAFGTGAGSSSTFSWDGSSNIVIQFCWSNNTTGGTSNYAKIDATGFTSAAYYYSDSKTPAVLCATTTGSATSTNRPQFIFNAQVTTNTTGSNNWTWSDGTSNVLSAASGTVNPVNLTASNISVTYTATATDPATGCSSSLAIASPITVTPSPAAPTNASTTPQCGNPTYTATTTVSTPTFHWYDAATSGTLLATNTNGIYAAINTNSVWVSVNNGTCESPRTLMSITINTPDAVAANANGSATPAATCPNTAIALSAVQTGTTNTYTYTWTCTTSNAATSGISGSVTGNPVNVTTTAAGTYTYLVTAVDGPCTTTSSVTITVGTPPNVLTATASPTPVCSGAAVSLAATSGTVAAGTASDIGTATTLTSNISYPTAFGNRWYQDWHQMVYTKAELLAAGLRAGNITSIAFNIAAIGSSATVNNYTVAIGTTASTTLSAFTTTGLTTVYGPTNTSTAVGWNTITFATPYNWDGNSNLIIDLRALEQDLTYNATTYYTATAGNTLVYAYSTSSAPTFWTSSPAVNTSTSRFNIRFSGQVQTTNTGSYNWTWSDGTSNVLSAASGTVNPLNATASPIAITYTATATDPVTGCASSLSISSPITVNPLPAAPTNTSTTPQCGTPTFTASTTVSSPTFHWYDAATSGTLLATTTTGSYTATSYSAGTNTVWVSVNNGTCEGPRTPIAVFVNTPDAVTAKANGSATPAASCPNTAIALSAVQTGTTNTYTYTWTCTTSNASTSGISGSVTGNPVNVTPTAAGTYTYLVTAVDGLCTNTSSVTILVNTPPNVLTATATPTPVCTGSAVTLTATSGTITAGFATSLGTATTTTTAAGLDPTAFNNRYSQYWSQSIYTGAELQAAGLRAGNITSIQFNISSIGDAASNANYQVLIGTTAGTTVSSLVNSGLTSVYGPSTYTHAVGLNTITFTTPYNWDGTSNLIIDIRHDGIDNINNASTYYTATAGNTIGSAVTSTTSATTSIQSLVASSSVTPSYSTKRLNIVFGGQVGTTTTGSLNWTWSDGTSNVLSAASGTVTASNATASPIIVTYTATATDPATGCSTQLSAANVTVNPLPQTPTDLAAGGSASGTSFTTIDGSFTAAATTAPTGYVVLRTASTVTSAPALTDNTTYTVGNVPGTGYVEYVNTTAGSWTSTGLTACTSYNYWVYSYNSGCAGNTKYSTSATPITGTTICCPTFNNLISIGGATTTQGSLYPTITAAVSAMSICGITQPTVLELNSSYTPASETYPLVLNTITGQSATNTITIRPAAGVTVAMTSSNTTTAIDLNGAKYWIIDGRQGGTGSTVSLSITNTSTATGGAAMRFINDAQNNLVEYVTVKSGYSSTTAGTINFSSAATLGNNNNTIQYCNIDGGAGNTASPTTGSLNGIYSNGTSTVLPNTGNIVDNNNIYDQFVAAATGNSCAVNLNTNNSAWTITNNKMYQTAARVATAGNTYRGVQISTTSGGGYTITGNVFGFATAAGTGTMTYSGSAGRISAFDLSMATTPVSSVQGNTVSNISLSTTSGAAANYGVFSGIYISAGAVNVGTITPNIIGAATGTGAISITATTTGALLQGIAVASTATCVVQNNIVASIGTGSNAFGYTAYGILTSGTGAFTVQGNAVGGSTAASFRVGTSGTTTGATSLAGIYVSNTGAQTISGNTVNNLSQFSSSATTSAISGITSFGSSAASVTSNTVSNLTTNSAVTSYFGALGIVMYNPSGAQTLSQNTIFAIRNTSATSANTVAGIKLDNSSSLGGTVSRNKVYDLTATGSGTPGIIGLENYYGSWTIQNNMISIVNGSNTNASTIIGIDDQPGTSATSNLYYNSVYVGGTAASGSATSTGYNRVSSFSPTVILKNNIFVNARTGGTGVQYAIANGTTTTGWTSNYNMFNAPSTTMGLWNGATKTFATWQAVAGDANSLTGITGTSGNYATFSAPTTGDLHLATDANCALDGAGTVIGGITVDYDADTRGTPPDIGADEFTGTFVFNVTNPASGCSTVDLTLPSVTTGSTAGVTLAYYTDAAGTLTLALPGNVTVSGTYYIKATKGSCSSIKPVTITVTVPGQWLGVSTNWFSGANWCGGIPGAGTNVIIPAGVANYPIITTGNAAAKNISIAANASITVSGTGIMSLNGAISNAGIFDLTDGTLDMAGNNVSVSGASIKNATVKNLEISNNSSLSVTANDTLKVTGHMYFGNVNSKTFTTNGNLTLVSNAAGTAALDDITNNSVNSGNAVTGTANVERYIPAVRKWRFLAVNTTGAAGSLTVQNAWMEGQTPGSTPASTLNGHGMWITNPAPATGFDAVSPGATMKYWDVATSTYIPISNPTTFDIRNALTNNAYMTFVRGDRTATGGNSVLASTVLRTTGSLSQYTSAAMTITPGTKITPIANPYASQIDIKKLVWNLNGGSSVVNIQVWDPNLGASYTLGAFQYITGDLNGTLSISPGGGSYGAATSISTIESGQAFYVQGSALSRTLQFVETAKTTNTQYVPFFTAGQEQILKAQFSIKDAGGNPTLVDGTQVRFDTHYNTAADPDDARKLVNTSENISVKRENQLMAVEYRNLPDDYDTVQLNIANLRAANYQWTFSLSNMDQPGRTAFLIDRYLNTETPLNLTGTITYDFPVVNIAGSYAANRFLVVFRPAAVVPVTLTSISATRLADKTVIVKWHAENEIGINHYELQRSGNGTQFISIASDQSPTNNAGGSASYSKIDLAPLNGDNYYRIKAISNNGRVQYTAIVKVDPLVKEGSISIYPNPISDRVMNLKFAGETPGKYQLQLSDKAGRIVYTSTVTITDGNEVKSLNIGDGLRSGGYDLVIIGADGKKKVIAVVLE